MCNRGFQRGLQTILGEAQWMEMKTLLIALLITVLFKRRNVCHWVKETLQSYSFWEFYCSSHFPRVRNNKYLRTDPFLCTFCWLKLCQTSTQGYPASIVACLKSNNNYDPIYIQELIKAKQANNLKTSVCKMSRNCEKLSSQFTRPQSNILTLLLLASFQFKPRGFSFTITNIKN